MTGSRAAWRGGVGAGLARYAAGGLMSGSTRLCRRRRARLGGRWVADVPGRSSVTGFARVPGDLLRLQSRFSDGRTALNPG
jgi:hypothetical protein